MATATQDMVEAGTQQIDELTSSIKELDARMAEAEAELAALHEAQQERDQAVSKARVTCDKAEAEHTQAANYAKLAHGTIREKESIKEVSTTRKQLETAKKELAKLERETAEANQLYNVRHAELDKQLHLLQFAKETHQAEIAGVSSGLDKAKLELGSETYEDLHTAWHEKQSRVDALKEQLITAQADALDCYQHAVKELAPWPVLQKSIACHIQREDSTSRALEAALLYMDVFLHEAATLQELPEDFKRRGLSLWDLLLVPQNELMMAHRHSQFLQDRRYRVQQALADYYAHLQLIGGDEHGR